METLTRFAWAIGLAGLLALLTFLSLWFLNQTISGPWTTGFGIAAGLLLAAYGFLDRESLDKGVHSRTFRFGTGALAMIVLAGAVAVVAFRIADDHDERWDLTRDKRFSLADRSVKVAAELDREVRVIAFFRATSPERARLEKLLEGYVAASPKISVTWFDPLLNPRMADAYRITNDYGTVILESGDERQRLESAFTEEAITQALIKLVSGEDHEICWVMGHGELDPDDDQSAEGLGGLVLKLEDMNYTVTKTNTLTGPLDRSCAAVVIARPTTDWLPIERERLAVYLAEGGRALVLLEPQTVPELSAELHRYGVKVGSDIVLETDPAHRLADIPDPGVIALSGSDLAMHPITQPLRGLVVLWVARSIKADPLVQGFRTHELLQSSAQSWGETTLDVDPEDMEATPEAFEPNEGVDLFGPVPMMVAVEVMDPEAIGVSEVAGEEEGVARLVEGRAGAVPADFTPAPGGRLVVSGDASFAGNQLYLLGNNRDLFIHAVAWLVDEESQLAQGPEQEGDSLSLNVVQGLLVWLISVFLVPGLAVALAILMMLRRRFL